MSRFTPIQFTHAIVRSSLVALVLLSLGLLARGDVVFYEELPYFQRSDSPFFDRLQGGDGFLEDFEDHELNTPNVFSWDVPRPGSLQIGMAHLTPQNAQITWSVDEDDGLNGDFIGAGDTWTTINAAQGGILGEIRLGFEPDDLGRYPTWAGFVVTEALDPFDEFEFNTLTLSDAQGPEFGFDPLSWIPSVGSFPGDTRTHRFFGLEVDDGITQLIVSNARQIDHLQYGYESIPEPSASLLFIGAFGAWLLRRKRLF